MARRLANAIENAPECVTSPLVRLETCMVLANRLDVEPGQAEARFDRFVAESGIEVVSITDAIGTIAVAAFQKYGKGRKNRAKLNLADCFSYACARERRDTLLFVGDDFSHTDIEPARY